MATAWCCGCGCARTRTRPGARRCWSTRSSRAASPRWSLAPRLPSMSLRRPTRRGGAAAGSKNDGAKTTKGGRVNLYLIRHGETPYNRDGLGLGRADVALTDLGERQAAALGRRFATVKLDKIICSPLQRARQTAAAVAG